MIPKQILEKIKRIQITTTRLVANVFAGEYKSVFKGRGLDFFDIREYQIGDDLRMIDWNVTARTRKAYVKRYIEERELTIMILLDASRSNFFGTVNDLKKNIAAELSSVIAGSAIKNNDKAGLIIFTDRIEKFIPPRKGVRHVFKIIREALYYEPKGSGTNIPLALEYLNKVTRKSAVVFIISDFQASNLKKSLSIANKRHDIVAVNISDPRDVVMPDVGAVRLRDAESGKEYLLDTSSSAVRKKYHSDSLRRMDECKKLFYSVKIDSVDINTAEPYEKALTAFFKIREKRRNR